MTWNPVRQVTLLFAAVGLLASLSGCPICPGSVFFPDPALELAVRQSLNAPLSCLTEDSLLGLTELQASGLGIKRLDGLEHCRNLTVLNISNNEIQSIGALTQLFNLSNVDLSINQITNIEHLSGLFFLDVLNLDQNPVVDWRPLAANVENGGFQAGSLVIVGSASVEDVDGNVTPNFQRTLDALLDAGVDVEIVEN
jgi:hypothetical protein